MPIYNAVAFFFDVVISLGIVLLFYALLGKSLRELLDKTIRLPAGSTFYMRALVVVLLCGALTKVIGGIHLKPEEHFMEYVWAVARDISNVFDNLIVILLVYVGIVTILVVVLKPKNE
jgi:small basic protein